MNFIDSFCDLRPFHIQSGAGLLAMFDTTKDAVGAYDVATKRLSGLKTNNNFEISSLFP
ncbi:putative transcription factor AP2-EREBP family [Helianthus annuus]|nr:putative transcription factor AP2-EREBP family [Helianthus annuus]